MKRILLSSVFLMAILCYSNAEAQTETRAANQTDMWQSGTQSAFSLGPRTGFFTGDNADSPAWFIGLQGRYRMGSVIDLEAAVDYIWLHQFAIEEGNFEAEAEFRSIPVTASVLIHAPFSQHIVPYGIAGAGLYITFQDFGGLPEFDDGTSTDFGFHLGAGLEIPVSGNVSVRGEWKHLFIEDADEFNEQMLSGNAFSAGITYYFR